MAHEAIRNAQSVISALETDNKNLKAQKKRESDNAEAEMTEMRDFIQLSGNHIRFQEFQLQRRDERERENHAANDHEDHEASGPHAEGIFCGHGTGEDIGNRHQEAHQHVGEQFKRGQENDKGGGHKKFPHLEGEIARYGQELEAERDYDGKQPLD